MKLELFYAPYCPFCQIVLAKIKFLGLSSQITLRDTMQDETAAKWHFQKTGRNTVPCLYIDQKPLFESSDINDWLENNQEEIKE